MEWQTAVTFVAYFLLMLGIGVYFYFKSSNIEDYLLGGRGMGPWVTALSAQASDMSGWLLMGLPGAIYLAGISKSWIAIGLFIGTVLNWKLVSARLRVYTQKTNAITLPCFFEARFRDPTGLLRIISAIIILIFFAIFGLGERMYEIVPGFIANCAVICLVNAFVGQKDQAVLREFEQVVDALKAG